MSSALMPKYASTRLWSYVIVHHFPLAVPQHLAVCVQQQVLQWSCTFWLPRDHFCTMMCNGQVYARLMHSPDQTRTVCNCLQSSLRFSFSGTGRLFNRKFISSWGLNLPNERIQAPFWYTGLHTFRKPPGLHQADSKMRCKFP